MTQDILKRNNVTIKGKGKQVMLFAHGFGCNGIHLAMVFMTKA
jgi:sigma-B regulation protein RsbQ